MSRRKPLDLLSKVRQIAKRDRTVDAARAADLRRASEHEAAAARARCDAEAARLRRALEGETARAASQPGRAGALMMADTWREDVERQLDSERQAVSVAAENVRATTLAESSAQGALARAQAAHKAVDDRLARDSKDARVVAEKRDDDDADDAWRTRLRGKDVP